MTYNPAIWGKAGKSHLCIVLHYFLPPCAAFVIFILLPAGTSIVLPVGYVNQPTGLLHIYLWRRLCGRQRRRFIQITS